jgi:SpoIID/LytB domain protein
VPAESSASWLPAALQAQAVAARSYVLSTLQPNGTYDTCDTTACQVYHGFAARSASGALSSNQPASTNAAVAATAGRYRTYGGAAAFTQFSASNGGWTTDGGKPYLVAAADPFSVSTGSASGDAAGTWTTKLSVATVSARCPSGGTATSLSVTDRDGHGEWGGRVTGLTVTCTTGTVKLTGVGSSRFDLKSSWWLPVPTMSGGASLAAWTALGGASSFLGEQTQPEAPTKDGRGSYTPFAGGVVYWSPASGAHEVHGAIAARWSAMGWEGSVLGYPVTDESKTPDGGGRYNHFQGGSVYWSPATGAHEVHGGIRADWASLGWEASVLGYPVTDESKTPDGVGRFEHFQSGSVYWSPATGAHEVHGAIKAEWASLGWERSVLGYPVTDESKTPDGGGRYNHFSGGSVYWSPSTGAHAVTGAARTAWAAAGWEGSRLGYPTSDTTAVAGGTRTGFQGGTITVKGGVASISYS